VGGIFMGKFTYKEEVNNWKWDIPEKYNIGYDVIDKHADGKNKDKIALLWEDSKGNSEKTKIR
jgi:acyl-coenzyme A synthetase/AMP-(fatty) acid ligase